MLLRPQVTAVADGRFELSVTSATERLPANLLIAYCWSQVEMEHAEVHLSQSNEIRFRSPNQTGDKTVTISLPHSSKHENGQKDSYHEPKFIVIQYEANGQIRTKSFAVPEGRGDRELRIEVKDGVIFSLEPER